MLKETLSYSQKEEVLRIEKGSLLADIDNIGPMGYIDEELGSRKILLFRYPVRKPVQM